MRGFGFIFLHFLSASFCLPVLFLLTVGAEQALAVSTVEPTNYDYPFEDDPYFATMSVGLLRPESSKGKPLQIPAIQGRSNVRGLESEDKTELRVFLQDHSSTLIYLIPGFSGEPKERSAQWFADLFYRAGFSVIVVPSPFHWRFIVSQGTTGAPGYTPNDAEDLIRVMLAARKKVETEYHAEFTHAAVFGYSLGALEAAYIMKAERVSSRLQIERVGLLNPPMRIVHAMQVLDDLALAGERWPEDYRSRLRQYVFMQGVYAFLRDNEKRGYFEKLRNFWQLDPEHAQFYVGDVFRRAFSQSVFASQQINDLRLLKSPAKKVGTRKKESRSVLFIRYLADGLWPFWQKRLGDEKLGLEGFVKQGDFIELRDFVASDSVFRMAHNSDDFLSDVNDIRNISFRMGGRAVVYPFGGHLGNVWKDQNKSDLVAMFADLR